MTGSNTEVTEGYPRPRVDASSQRTTSRPTSTSGPAVSSVTLGVGDQAPDFTLAGTDGTEEGERDYRLSDYAGRSLVLIFYPGDNTPVCTRQLTTYTTDIEQFAAVDADILAISPQSVESHRDFARQQGGFAFPLLADTAKRVGARYSVLGPIGFYRRSAFVIDADGIIRYAHRAVAGLTYRPTSELVDAVRAAQS